MISSRSGYNKMAGNIVANAIFHGKSALLFTFRREIHRWPVDFPSKGKQNGWFVMKYTIFLIEGQIYGNLPAMKASSWQPRTYGCYWIGRNKNTLTEIVSNEELSLWASSRFEHTHTHHWTGFNNVQPCHIHLEQWPPESCWTISHNGNIFRVTGHLCGEFTGPRWIPRTKASGAELWCFLWSASE